MKSIEEIDGHRCRISPYLRAALAYSDDELFDFSQFVIECNYWLHIESMDNDFFGNAMDVWSNAGKIDNFRRIIDLIVNNEEHKDKQTLLSIFLSMLSEALTNNEFTHFFIVRNIY